MKFFQPSDYNVKVTMLFPRQTRSEVRLDTNGISPGVLGSLDPRDRELFIFRVKNTLFLY